MTEKEGSFYCGFWMFLCFFFFFFMGVCFDFMLYIVNFDNLNCGFCDLHWKGNGSWSLWILGFGNCCEGQWQWKLDRSSPLERFRLWCVCWHNSTIKNCKSEWVFLPRVWELGLKTEQEVYVFMWVLIWEFSKLILSIFSSKQVIFNVNSGRKAIRKLR